MPCAHAGDLPDTPPDRVPHRRETTAVDATGTPADGAAPTGDAHFTDPSNDDMEEDEAVPADSATQEGNGERCPKHDLTDPGEIRDLGERPAVRIVPPGIDPARLRPSVTVYVHLSAAALEAGTRSGCGVARIESVGPVTLQQAQRFFGTGPNITGSTITGCNITVQPVINPADTAPADAYEIPTLLREAMVLRTPADIFPYGEHGSRSLDLDHTEAYRPPAGGGPPGQTGLHNLGPLTRYHHRVKTHGRWQVRQPEPGVYLWRSPTGWFYLVNTDGTHSLGHNGFGQMVWRAVNQPKATAEAAA